MENELNDITIDTVHPLRRNADPLAIVGGFGALTAAVVGMLLLPSILRAASVEDMAPPANGGFEYIEAKLLKAGEIKDPKKLPDRIVPALPTAPEEVLPLDMNEEKEVVEEEKKPEEQKDAVDDEKLRQVFDKARAFAEIQDDYVPEGHPDGIPDGDVTDPSQASMGATYGREIGKFITERWIVPTLISDDERNRLKVKVNIRFNAEMTIISYEILTKSGNNLFDDSVVNAIDLLQREVRHLPDPPEGIAARVFGGGLTMTLYGADAEGK